MRKRGGVGQIVDRDDVDAAVVHGGAHDARADPAGNLIPTLTMRSSELKNVDYERLARRSNDGQSESDHPWLPTACSSWRSSRGVALLLPGGAPGKLSRACRERFLPPASTSTPRPSGSMPSRSVGPMARALLGASGIPWLRLILSHHQGGPGDLRNNLQNGRGFYSLAWLNVGDARCRRGCSSWSDLIWPNSCAPRPRR